MCFLYFVANVCFVVIYRWSLLTMVTLNGWMRQTSDRCSHASCTFHSRQWSVSCQLTQSQTTGQRKPGRVTYTHQRITKKFICHNPIYTIVEQYIEIYKFHGDFRNWAKHIHSCKGSCVFWPIQQINLWA